jgi:hypothetical protein
MNAVACLVLNLISAFLKFGVFHSPSELGQYPRGSLKNYVVCDSGVAAAKVSVSQAYHDASEDGV